MSKTELHLNLKIVCLDGIRYEKNVHYFSINLKDGLMVINKNYASVIEEVKCGTLKIHEDIDKKPINYEISDGWLSVSNNKCELFVNYAKQIN